MWHKRERRQTCWLREWIVSSLMSLLATIFIFANHGMLNLRNTQMEKVITILRITYFLAIASKVLRVITDRYAKSPLSKRTPCARYPIEFRAIATAQKFGSPLLLQTAFE
jgi:hypothetical protein